MLLCFDSFTAAARPQSAGAGSGRESERKGAFLAQKRSVTVRTPGGREEPYLYSHALAAQGRQHVLRVLLQRGGSSLHSAERVECVEFEPARVGPDSREV